MHLTRAALLALASLALAAPALAKGESDRAAQMHDAVQKALAAAVHGPAKVSLRDQATLQLPAGEQFVPTAPAKRLMELMGNSEGDGFVGLVMPGKGANGWMVDVSYTDSGYIKDDDAKSNWNPDELFKSLKEGTEAGNEDRKKMGLPGFEVVGWVEKPTYDAAHRRLVWAASTKEEGAPAADGINYNTYALGREGYISMNLITDLAKIEQYKPVAKTLLANLTFTQGKQYGDFNASTDKVAEYGLAALVAGVAVHKLGLFALAGVFILKFIKVIALAAVGGLAAVRRFFGGKKKQDDQAA